MKHASLGVLLTFLVFLLGSVPPNAFALDNAEQADSGDCLDHSKDIPIKSLTASASFWGNMRNRPGSINYESNVIFLQAKAEADHLTPPENFCPSGCKVSPRASFFFYSVPAKHLSAYRDEEHCSRLKQSTLESPLTYRNDVIRSVEDLNTWIKDLSTGEGPHGEDLYERCDKSCSPQYKYIVTRAPEPDTYSVKASIICGPARDKDDNNYLLRAFFRWKCKKA